MHLHIIMQHIFYLVLGCLCRVPIEIQSTVDDQYLDLSGEFVGKETQENQFYAEIEDGDAGEFKFRIMDGKGRILRAKQKRQTLAWSKSKKNGTLWSVRKLAGSDAGYVMTDTGFCLKHSPDKVYLDRCPKSKDTAACPDYIFKVAFNFDKEKLGECRMALAERKKCNKSESTKTIAECAKACCRSRMKSAVQPACNTCEKTASCERSPNAIGVLKARRAACGGSCGSDGGANRCTMPLMVSNVSQIPRRPAGACCGSAGTYVGPKLNMLIQEPEAEQDLSEVDEARNIEAKARKGGILSNIIAGDKEQGESQALRNEDVPNGKQYLMLNSQDSSKALGSNLDSAAVKEIGKVIAGLGGDKGKNVQNNLENVKDTLEKTLSSESLEALAKEKKKLEDDSALNIGMLSKQLAELKNKNVLSKASSPEKKSSAENVLEKLAKAAAGSKETTDKMAQTINNAAGELGNISKVLNDSDTKKKTESVVSSVGEIADLAKGLAPPQVALAAGLLSKLGI